MNFVNSKLLPPSFYLYAFLTQCQVYHNDHQIQIILPHSRDARMMALVNVTVSSYQSARYTRWQIHLYLCATTAVNYFLDWLISNLRLPSALYIKSQTTQCSVYQIICHILLARNKFMKSSLPAFGFISDCYTQGHCYTLLYH